MSHFPTNICPDHFHDKCFSPGYCLLISGARLHPLSVCYKVMSDIYCVLSDIYVGNEVIRRGFMAVISDPARDIETSAIMMIIMMSDEK